jgi:hypothetical protein
MDIQARIDHLVKEHRALDKEIKLCYSNYIKDPLLEVMKKRKLAMKDEIEQLKRQQNET